MDPIQFVGLHVRQKKRPLKSGAFLLKQIFTFGSRAFWTVPGLCCLVLDGQLLALSRVRVEPRRILGLLHGGRNFVGSRAPLDR